MAARRQPTWGIVHLLLGAAFLPVAPHLWQQHGRRAAARFLLGLGPALLLQYGVIERLRQHPGLDNPSGGTGVPTLADVITLSRGAAAAGIIGLLLAERQAPSRSVRWLAWFLLLWGVVLGDWLDGPLARRVGVSRLGTVLDLEVDSWLTLWTSVGAVVWGEASRWVVLAPTLRYLLPVMLADPRGPQPGRRIAWWQAGGPPWGRVTGGLQMAALLAVLAPCGGDRWRADLGRAAHVAGLGQLLSLLISAVQLHQDGHDSPPSSEAPLLRSSARSNLPVDRKGAVRHSVGCMMVINLIGAYHRAQR